MEIFYKGRWGLVCHHDWDLKDASVVCRELGYGNAVKASSVSNYRTEVSEYWFDYVNCTGNELNLASCLHSKWGKTNCESSEQAIVNCSKGLVLMQCFLYVKFK